MAYNNLVSNSFTLPLYRLAVDGPFGTASTVSFFFLIFILLELLAKNSLVIEKSWKTLQVTSSNQYFCRKISISDVRKIFHRQVIT